MKKVLVNQYILFKKIAQNAPKISNASHASPNSAVTKPSGKIDPYTELADLSSARWQRLIKNAEEIQAMTIEENRRNNKTFRII